jgi:two-component system chemotaxis response regulator CheB
VTFHAAKIPAIVGIGASAGGPGALARVLGGLPAEFPIPIVIVQHLSAEFVPGLAEWLDRSCAISVRLAVDGETPQPGTAYMAPGNAHLRLSADRRLMLDYSEGGVYRHRPAVDALFESLATVYEAHSIAIVLTGMGDDGAIGLETLRKGGARTIAQDAQSCVVFGMPAAAIERGAAEYVLPLNMISRALMILGGRGGTRSLVGATDSNRNNPLDNSISTRAPKPTG